MKRISCVALLGSLGLVACGGNSSPGSDEEGSSDSSGTDPSATTNPSTSDPSDPTTTNPSDPSDPTMASGTDESSSSDTAVDESSTTDATASCGNMVVDDGEDCDDGNDVDGDGCNVDCVESGSVRWELVQGTDAGGNDCARDVSINAAGQVAIGGEAQSADLETYDVLALSIDPTGTVGWEMVYDSASDTESGGGQTDRGYGVAIEDDGEVIVSGHEYLDVEHVWVRKLDANGAELWTRTGADTDDGRGYGVALGDNGDVFVVGTHGLYAFVTKYNTNGLEFWTEERKGSDGCNGCDNLFRARAYDDGGIVAGGSYDNMNGDAAVVRMDADGNDVWSDIVDSMDMYSDYVIAVGANGASTLVGIQLADNDHADLHSYDADGNVEWTLADPFVDAQLVDVEGMPDGGFVALATKYDMTAGYSAIVRRYDAEGGMMWDRELAGPAMGYQEPRAIAGCEAEAEGYEDVWVAVLAP
ncbi:MAG TPA: hypothetical protein VG755_20955 [Nannocystaceae bacterium]|nr:hypothetical protein [Nannocystaceae bacterium]